MNNVPPPRTYPKIEPLKKPTASVIETRYDAGRRVGELGLIEHRILAGPARQHVLNVRERLRQAADQGARLLDDRAAGAARRFRRHAASVDDDGDREAEPARSSEPALQPVCDRREVDSRGGSPERRASRTSMTAQDEQDDEGRNKERHKRGARQPARGGSLETRSALLLRLVILEQLGVFRALPQRARLVAGCRPAAAPSCASSASSC